MDVLDKQILRDLKNFLKFFTLQRLNSNDSLGGEHLLNINFTDPIQVLEGCITHFKEQFGYATKYSEFFLVPLLFAKEFQNNAVFAEFVLKRSHRKMDESRFVKTVACFDNYSLKKLKKILNYPHFFALIQLYSDYLTADKYTPAMSNDRYKQRVH